MRDYVQVQVAIDDRDRAASLARSVVEARLAACAQLVGPIVSTYWWEGRVETAEEFLLLLKTTGDSVDRLTEHIRAEHPYETPEIVALPIEGGLTAYLDWIASETRQSL
ncbi:divalent-cation tolerance protein CutA [Sphaerimonospora mesophila]|uniref:divalent-cation tolerance protein CutA n=1 Tax=Sphaerimonospora mesophila TaxID=37483 RepID=UPI0006E4580A